MSQERGHGGANQVRPSVTCSPDRGGMQSLIGVLTPRCAFGTVLVEQKGPLKFLFPLFPRKERKDMFHWKTFGWKSLVPILILALFAFPLQVNSEEPDTANWVQKESGLQCTAVGVRADGTISDALNPVWKGDGVDGNLPDPTFKYIRENENRLNVVEFETFDFYGYESSLTFEIEVFSQREELTLTVKRNSFRTGNDEMLDSDQLIVQKSDFVNGSNYVLQLAIDEESVPQNYEPFLSYTIVCRLDLLENNRFLEGSYLMHD